MSDFSVHQQTPRAGGGAVTGLPDHLGYRWLGDEELRHWLRHYRRHLALVDEDHPDPGVRASTRAFLALQVAAAEAEEGRRRRAALRGVPRDADRFPAAWLADLKRGIALDVLAEDALGARLGPADRRGRRRGPCPLCTPSDRSACFVVHTADAANQRFHCFRCHAGGDAVTLIMHAYGDPFPAAVRRLAGFGDSALPPRPVPIAPPASATAAPRFEFRGGKVVP